MAAGRHFVRNSEKCVKKLFFVKMAVTGHFVNKIKKVKKFQTKKLCIDLKGD